MAVEWNKQSRRYIRDGKAIPPASVRKMVLDTIGKAKERLANIAGQKIKGEINSPAWFVATRSEVKNMHTALAMLAQGGKGQMDVKAWGRTGQKIKSELEYLRGFQRSIERGELSDAQILARAIQYADASYVTYQQGVFNLEKMSGTQYVNWILDETAESCDGCKASEGVHPVNNAPELGSNECGGKCRCSYEFAEYAEAA
jgi:hypothetical protein